MLIDRFLKIIVCEGISAILKPFCEIIQDTPLHDSILFALIKADLSGEYDFRGYIKNITGLKSLDNVSQKSFKKKIKSKFKTSLKIKSVKEIIRKLQKDLESDIYFIAIDKLEENLPKDVFYKVFGTPELDNQQKKIIDLIWNAFHVKVLKIIDQKNLLTRLYQQSTPSDNIKRIINYKIEKDANSRISKEQRNDYKKVWENLIDLEIAAEKMWHHAIKDNLDNFLKTFMDTRVSINKSGIFLKSKHHEKIQDLFEAFQIYSDGKNLLIKNKSFVFVVPPKQRVDPYTDSIIGEIFHTEKIVKRIEDKIEQNRTLRENYIKTLNSLMEEFHQYITNPLDFEETKAIAV